MTKNKIKLGAYLYPMPVVIVGANVEGKANFLPIAWVSIVEYKPPMISISSHQAHHTNIGIKGNGTFSVNTPSEGMLEVTDYCGIKSGKTEDKSEIFEIFYGELKTAPMIQHSPLNLECKVVKNFNTSEISGAEKGHEIFIGEIVNAYADEYYLTNGRPDVKKLNPFLYVDDNTYWKLSEQIGKAFSNGKNYKTKKE